MRKPVRNQAASVKARLRLRAAAEGQTVDRLYTRYVLERLLYRLGLSRHRKSFVLKGAMLFGIWQEASRPTKDLDLLAFGDNSPETIAAAVREICVIQPDQDDGVVFEPDSMKSEVMKEGQEYPGVRVRLKAYLGSSEVSVRIEVGFGDDVRPGIEEIEYPALLEGTTRPHVRAYPKETVVAEKLHAAVRLGTENTRLKDFFDLAALGREFEFSGLRLCEAIQATFERRRTPVPEATPPALTAGFYLDDARGQQWRSFLRKSSLPERRFDEVGEQIRGFVGPPLDALRQKAPFELLWPAGGPWGPLR